MLGQKQLELELKKQTVITSCAQTTKLLINFTQTATSA